VKPDKEEDVRFIPAKGAQQLDFPDPPSAVEDEELGPPALVKLFQLCKFCISVDEHGFGPIKAHE
jgi:hypothetical protein